MGKGSRNQHGGVYFVFLRQEGFRKPPRKHFVIHGKFMENPPMESSWKIEWKIHGEIHGKSMENPWEIHGKSMDNKNGKNVSVVLHGVSMGTHGDPWAPMRNHGFPWVPMGPHGDPWAPIDSHGLPWVRVPMGSHGSPWATQNTQRGAS